MPQLSVKTLSEANLPEVARIHCAAFKESIFTRLGHEAVRRYYLWLMRGPHDAIAIGVFDESNVLIGFCFGGIHRGALSGYLRQNRGFLIQVVLLHPWLLGHELFRERLKLAVGILLKRQKRRPPVMPPSLPKPVQKSFGILSIAVDPQRQRNGSGRLLMDSAEQTARRRSFQEMNLTVHPDNESAISFYEHLGWQRSGGLGTWDGSMSKRLIQ